MPSQENASLCSASRGALPEEVRTQLVHFQNSVLSPISQLSGLDCLETQTLHSVCIIPPSHSRMFLTPVKQSNDGY